MDKAIGSGCLENPPSSDTPYVDNDNINLHIGMEFGSSIDMYNFYNGNVKRVYFEITIVCSISNNKKELNFKQLACWRKEKF